MQKEQGDTELPSFEYFSFEYLLVQLFRKWLLALGYFMQALYLLPVY